MRIPEVTPSRGFFRNSLEVGEHSLDYCEIENSELDFGLGSNEDKYRVSLDGGVVSRLTLGSHASANSLSGYPPVSGPDSKNKLTSRGLPSQP